MQAIPPEQWTILPAYIFTAEEIANYTGIDMAAVKRVLAAFAIPHGEKRNVQFGALHDFNIASALPLIHVADDMHTFYSTFTALVEALYESPFYWMGADKEYVNTAMRHRGQFTEEFSVERLSLVFGKDKVYPNVDIFACNKGKVGEIDA